MLMTGQRTSTCRRFLLDVMEEATRVAGNRTGWSVG